MGKNRKQSKRPLYRRKGFLWPAGIVLGIIIVTFLGFWLSPWPGALLIRYEFTKNGATLTEEMKRHEPASGVAVISNQQYRLDDRDAMLDVYMPEGAAEEDKKLPVVIWTHGGAWLSGDKTDAAPYFKLLAREGYTVIAPNYSLAPEHAYPTPIHQLNDMYRYIGENARRFHADMDKIIFAGDSAGANLSAQMAALVTNPAYAKDLAITPNLRPEQLKGVVLNCGIYMMEKLANPGKDLSKIVRWGDDVTVWAYSGTQDFSDPIITQMSPYYYVTREFPATYISGGNADPLTDAQSKPLADKLDSLGVEVVRLFYPKDHTPALSHEYQFMLDKKDAQNALKQTLGFIRKQVQ